MLGIAIAAITALSTIGTIGEAGAHVVWLASASTQDEPPWREETPQVVEPDGDVYAAEGSARIVLPEEFIGGAVLVTQIEGNALSLLYPAPGESDPEAWPQFGGMLFDDSPYYGSAGLPVYSETLWVRTSEPWRVRITALESPEAFPVTGIGSGWIVVPADAGAATITADVPLQSIDVVGSEGIEFFDPADGARRLPLDWPRDGLAVIGVRLPDGFEWRIELAGDAE